MQATVTTSEYVLYLSHSYAPPHRKISSGASIVIHSWPYYLQNPITLLKTKGAIHIISSPTLSYA